ncbi:MAG: ATP-dependent DNA helicase RecQ [Deltaproteobacteria bacterium]|nr:ATP-dependent DNA helicase RecQ [Deltaproteobacteria bacterium]
MPTRDELLTERFGLSAFHPWQREAIDALLDGGGRVLVVAPTGGGKSLCYQFPATVLGGTTVVISPLIALMDDQVRSLSARGIPATYLASTLEFSELRHREEQLAAGRYRLVYVAPERLRKASLVNLLARARPQLVAVDEAHCISQWGHDFRPDYLRIGEALNLLAPGRVLACTATATPAVRDEILERLAMRGSDTTVVLRGFARPNLHLEVDENDSMATRRTRAIRKVAQVLGEPSSPGGAAIIYAGTRRNTERTAADLVDQGWSCKPYHAGLDPALREDVSEAFARRKLDVVVATNAFGMGIDRPDIRCVVHVQAPGSIEQYYQEVGRAGRDGQPAHGLLISGSSDFGFRRRLIERSDPRDLKEPDPEHIERQWRLFLDLMRYVEAGSCRHDFILRYFGDDQETLGGCGHCDVCEQLDADGSAAGSGGPSEDDVIVVQKALSGVARLQGRAGLAALASSLHGADTERMRQLGLTRLSTHGLLNDRPQRWIMALLRRLMTASLVDLTASDFPVPYLTGEGRATMTGALPVRVILPSERVGRARPKKRAKKKAAAAALLGAADEPLFDQLRAARMEAAKARGVPPYVVCHDRTLVEIATAKPMTLAELELIHGMGPARIDAHGEGFLSVVRAKAALFAQEGEGS